MSVGYGMSRILEMAEYEILLPWMVTGIFLLAIGLLLVILPEKGKKLPTKINDITEASE